jgi:hypothetical protein
VSRRMMLAVLFLLLSSAVASPEPAQKLVVRGRLLDPGPTTPHCGMYHFAVVMKYRVVEVVAGQHRPTVVYALHGCPEIPRSHYGAEAGTLVHFKVGDLHRLVLHPSVPPGIDVVVDVFKKSGDSRYWVRRVDLDRPPSDDGVPPG